MIMSSPITAALVDAYDVAVKGVAPRVYGRFALGLD
jgi:hypothetical protein